MLLLKNDSLVIFHKTECHNGVLLSECIYPVELRVGLAAASSLFENSMLLNWSQVVFIYNICIYCLGLALKRVHVLCPHKVDGGGRWSVVGGLKGVADSKSSNCCLPRCRWQIAGQGIRLKSNACAARCSLIENVCVVVYARCCFS